MQAPEHETSLLPAVSTPAAVPTASEPSQTGSLSDSLAGPNTPTSTSTPTLTPTPTPAEVSEQVKVTIVVGRKTVRNYGLIYNDQIHAMEKERFYFKVAELEEQLNNMDRRLSASDDAFVSSQKALSATQLALKKECRVNDSAVACLKKNGEAVPEVSPFLERVFL